MVEAALRVMAAVLGAPGNALLACSSAVDFHVRFHFLHIAKLLRGPLPQPDAPALCRLHLQVSATRPARALSTNHSPAAVTAPSAGLCMSLPWLSHISDVINFSLISNICGYMLYACMDSLVHIISY